MLRVLRFFSDLRVMILGVLSSLKAALLAPEALHGKYTSGSRNCLTMLDAQVVVLKQGSRCQSCGITQDWDFLQYISHLGCVQNSRVCSVTLIYINWFGRSIFMSLL